MSLKRMREILYQGDQLITAMGKVSDSSPEFDALYEMYADNTRRLLSASKAVTEARSMKYTTCGDFTHLGAVGSVAF